MEEFNTQENRLKDQHWIKRHPVWSGIIGLIVLFFVIGMFTPNEETSDEDTPKEKETIKDFPICKLC